MEAVVKKHFWLVNLVFLALGAWLLAGSINGVIAHKLRQIPSMNLQASKASSLPRQSTEPSRDYQRITDLNYFESALTTPVEQGPAIDDSNAMTGMANMLSDAVPAGSQPSTAIHSTKPNAVEIAPTMNSSSA